MNNPARYRPPLASPTCQKCGGHNLYHDSDPARRHNGYTCLACGYEQVLPDGTKSAIKTNRGNRLPGRIR